ncbi:MAG: TolB family protein [Gemmatimonadaceae bacterium]
MSSVSPVVKTVVFAALAASCSAPVDDAVNVETLYSESPPVWFEAHRVLATISPNGRSATLPLRWPLSVRTIDLEKHAEAASSVANIVDSARATTFNAASEPIVLGWRSGAFGWYARNGDSVQRLPIPANARPQWSADGRQVAYFEAYARLGEPAHAVYAGHIDSLRRYDVGGRITGLTWLPDAKSLLLMVADSLGTSVLAEFGLTNGEVVVRARDLDADPSFSPVALTADGRKAIIALSTPDALRPSERHRPDADRDTDLYEIELATGAKRSIVATPAEEAAPHIVNGQLYWTHTAIDMSIVVLPIDGGEPRALVPGGFLPSWRPDGKALGFAYGGFLAADWVLNWEGGLIELDSAVNVTGEMRPVIAGFHEDFQPVWSPNARWIAYHSHRSTHAVPLYASPGSTDDIYVRRTGDSAEIRLTEYGWEVGSPDWSRDGRRLLFTGWLRPDKGEGRGTYAGIVTIDPLTGRPLTHRKIPLGQIPSAEMASWSPASDDIAIEGIARPGVHQIWITRPDGSQQRMLVEFAAHTYGGVDWTPDAKSIVYSAIADGRPQLFSISATGGSPRQLTRGDASILHPQISPDGRHIAATRIVQTKEIRRMPMP